MKQEERLKALQQLNNQIDREIKSMKIEKKQKIKTLKLGERLTTHCDKCKINCHHPCDCCFLIYVDVKFLVFLADVETVVVKKNIIN